MDSAAKSQTPRKLSNGVASKDQINPSSSDQMISFLLEALFSKNLPKLELRLAHALFHRSALVVLIPRQRPTLARAMKIEELLASNRDAIKCHDNWSETERVQETCCWMSAEGDDDKSLRIGSTVIVDTEPTSLDSRNIDVLFVIGVVTGAERVLACTLVYDETSSNAHSPITLI